MLVLLALLASFIPSILMFFFLRKNREDMEYRKYCGKVLWNGVLCAALVTLACAVLQLGWNLLGIGENSKLLNSLFNAFVLAAGVEESVKFFTAKKALKEIPALTRLDVISITAITAMGFGLIEDVVYTMQSNIPQILIRGVLMAHVSYGLFMGLVYGKGIQKKSPGLKALGLLLPILFHGLYNFSLDEGLPELFSYIAVGSALVSTVFLVVMIFFIRKKRKDPEFTTPLYEEKQREE